MRVDRLMARLHTVKHPAAMSTKRKLPIKHAMKPGGRLLREWRGKTYEVYVADDGCYLDGKRFRSLSAADVRAAQSMLIELRKSEKNLGSRERIREWASRLESINITETGITITLQPAAIFEQEILQSFKDKCHIHYDAAIGRRGIGLKVVAGVTEEIAPPDPTALDLIKRAADWRDRWFADSTSTLASIAKADGANPGDVSKHLRLAFLAPDIVKALLDGTAPQNLDAETLRRLPELPADWADQRRLLGFNTQS